MRAYDIYARDLLRHRVLDLDTGIHLDEKPLSRIHIQEKLNRTRVVVANSLGKPHGRSAQFGNRVIGQPNGRSNFNHFLVTPLDRAIPLVQVDHVTVLVSKDLHFQVLCPPNVSLEKHGGVPKCLIRFVASLLERGHQILFFPYHPHSSTSPAESRLDDKGETDLLGPLSSLGRFDYRIGRSRQGRHTRLIGSLAGSYLVAHLLQ